jgi:hypothetical protein
VPIRPFANLQQSHNFSSKHAHTDLSILWTSHTDHHFTIIRIIRRKSDEESIHAICQPHHVEQVARSVVVRTEVVQSSEAARMSSAPRLRGERDLTLGTLHRSVETSCLVLHHLVREDHLLTAMEAAHHHPTKAVLLMPADLHQAALLSTSMLADNQMSTRYQQPRDESA